MDSKCIQTSSLVSVSCNTNVVSLVSWRWIYCLWLLFILITANYTMFTSQRSPQEKNPSDFHNFQLFMCLTCWGGHILNFVFQISLCWFDTWKLVYSSSRGILLNLQNPPNSEITMECFGIFAYENSCLLFFCWSTNGFISFTYPFKLFKSFACDPY